MLGFEYQIYLIDNDVIEHPLDEFWKISETHKFAVFQVGPYSDLWIQQLEKQGIAKDRGGNNYYPNRYTVAFEHVLPQLFKEPEKYGAEVVGDDYFIDSDFIARVEVNQEILKRCKLDTLCLIEEWDMS